MSQDHPSLDLPLAISPEAMKGLQAQAADQGRDLAEYVLAILENALETAGKGAGAEAYPPQNQPARGMVDGDPEP